MLFATMVDAQQPYKFSEGIYRAPYPNGTNITMGSDVNTHNPLGKYDMWADNANTQIVAAASGWIRGIQETFDTACFTVVNNVVSCCPQFNNYVIIQHQNGEWSGYTHIQVNSATAQGISLNQFVTAGTPLGIEGSVGCSSGRHLHFEVSIPPDPNNAFAAVGGFLSGEKIIPVICGIGNNNSFFQAGNEYVAGSCNDNCSETIFVTDNLGNGQADVYRADVAILTSAITPPTFFNGSAAQFRAGSRVLLRPGFEIRSGSRFEALIKGCNQ